MKKVFENEKQEMRQNFENQFEACKQYYHNKMQEQRGMEKAQVAKEHELLETLNKVLQQRLSEKESEIEKQNDEIEFLRLELHQVGIQRDHAILCIEYIL